MLFDGAGKLWALGMTRGAVDFGGAVATEGSFHDRQVSAVVDPRTDAVLLAVTSGAVPSDVGTGPLEGAGSDVVLVRFAR